MAPGRPAARLGDRSANGPLHTLKRSWRVLASLPAIALAAGCGSLPHDAWLPRDTAAQAGVTAIIAADWAQTRDLVKNPCVEGPNCEVHRVEKGPASHIIGEHPSVGQVNNYFAATAILNAGIAWLLPRGWREGWQIGSAAYEMKFVLDNRSLGVKMTFR
jgi:hypothetical protein